MKKKRLFIIITIVVSVVIAFYFFLSASKETELLSKVPADAKSVLIIDIKGLTARLLMDELSSDEKSTEKIIKMLPDSLLDNDWTSSGINLMDKAIVFTQEEDSFISYKLLLPISNYQRFKQFSDSLKINPLFEKSKKSIVLQKFKLIASYNEEFLIMANYKTSPERKGKELQEILGLQKEMSVLEDSVFISKLSRKYDFLLYAKPYKYFPRKMKSLVNLNIAKSFSFIHFKDGLLSINSEIFFRKESLLDKVFSKQEQNIFQIIDTDSSSISATLNINPTAIFDFIEQFSSIKLNKEKIPLLEAWNGTAHFLLNSQKIVENKFISYEYDDNFNKIEVKKTTKEKVTDLQVNFGVDQTILSQVYNNKKVYREGSDTLLFKGAGFAIKNVGPSYLCYNKRLTMPKPGKDILVKGLSAKLDYNKFMLALNDFGIETDSIWLNNFDINKIEINTNKEKSITLNLNVFFRNKDKNAFFILAEKLNHINFN